MQTLFLLGEDPLHWDETRCCVTCMVTKFDRLIWAQWFQLVLLSNNIYFNSFEDLLIRMAEDKSESRTREKG